MPNCVKCCHCHKFLYTHVAFRQAFHTMKKTPHSLNSKSTTEHVYTNALCTTAVHLPTWPSRWLSNSQQAFNSRQWRFWRPCGGTEGKIWQACWFGILCNKGYWNFYTTSRMSAIPKNTLFAHEEIPHRVQTRIGHHWYSHPEKQLYMFSPQYYSIL